MVPLVFVLAALGSGPAFASPLTGATASAYGLRVDLLGTNLIPPTPAFSAGPTPGTGSDNLVTVPLDTLAFAGVAGAKAVVNRDSNLVPDLPLANLQVRQGGPALPANFNAKAYARTAGAFALGDAVPEAVSSLFGESDILSADAIHSEALASCVNGQTVIAGGTQLVGLDLLGADLTPLLDGTVNQVIPIVDGVLATLGASLVVNEQVVTPNGISVNALHLTIPSILEAVVAHTEVTGTTCAPIGPECSDGIDNDGDGKTDFPADPECKSRDDDSEAPECSNGKDDDGDGKIDRGDPGCYRNGNVNDPGAYDPADDTEADLLPRTGGDNVPLGMAILAGGGLLLLAGRKVRRASSEG
ncbi:MAG TPA: hypothetical protein VHL54_11675 [Actinomycetota bacterium]|nr:hypothetical protein [Actinomycetota bacterium]